MEKISQLLKTQSVRRIFLVGGSMFYTKVLKQGLPAIPQQSTEIKNHFYSLWKLKGLNYLTNLLKERDPDFYHEVDLNNSRRVIRALVIIESGVKPSQIRKERQTPPWEFLEIIPVFPRKIIYQRIEKRIMKMMVAGWVEEVSSLLKYYSPKEIRECSAIGYSEILDYLDGKTTYPNTIIQIIQKTRQLAKQQITWIKKEATGFLIFNPNSEYNINEVFNLDLMDFTEPTDIWMNRYPRSNSRKQTTYPSLLISDNPIKELEKELEILYE